jgi:hypothetical protein
VISVIVNKVAPADDWQARYLNLAGSRVKIGEGQTGGQCCYCGRYLKRSSDCASGSSLAALRRRCWIDFLTHVEDYFPSRSFRTLALCKRDYGRMTRRLRDLLGEAAGTDATIDHWGTYVLLTSDLVQSVYLQVTEDREGIELAFSPADTLTQARVFYRRAKIVTAVKALAELPGWQVQPNFHFGYRTPGFCWTHGEIELNDYIDLWSLRIAEGEHPVGPSDWGDYWEELVRLRVIDPDDRPEFDRCFRNRPSAPPAQGCGHQGAGRSPKPWGSTLLASSSTKSAKHSAPRSKRAGRRSGGPRRPPSGSAAQIVRNSPRDASAPEHHQHRRSTRIGRCFTAKRQ